MTRAAWTLVVTMAFGTAAPAVAAGRAAAGEVPPEAVAGEAPATRTPKAGAPGARGAKTRAPGAEDKADPKFLGIDLDSGAVYYNGRNSGRYCTYRTVQVFNRATGYVEARRVRRCGRGLYVREPAS